LASCESVTAGLYIEKSKKIQLASKLDRRIVGVKGWEGVSNIF